MCEDAEKFGKIPNSSLNGGGQPSNEARGTMEPKY